VLAHAARLAFNIVELFHQFVGASFQDLLRHILGFQVSLNLLLFEGQGAIAFEPSPVIP
jgi:hypothetical protein